MKTKEQYRQLLEAQLHKRKMLNAALLGGALIGGAANPTQAANTANTTGQPTVNAAKEEAKAKNKQRARAFAAAALATAAASLLAGRIKGSRRSE